MTAGLNSCLKRDRAWTKRSACAALRVPFALLTGRFAGCQGRVLRGELGELFLPPSPLPARLRGD